METATALDDSLFKGRQIKVCQTFFTSLYLHLSSLSIPVSPLSAQEATVVFLPLAHDPFAYRLCVICVLAPASAQLSVQEDMANGISGTRGSQLFVCSGIVTPLLVFSPSSSITLPPLAAAHGAIRMSSF